MPLHKEDDPLLISLVSSSRVHGLVLDRLLHPASLGQQQPAGEHFLLSECI